MAPTYPAVAQHLLALCRRYLQGIEDLETLKAEIWSAASQVSIPEERTLREFLQQSEGRLDMIQFTVDGPEVRRASMEVVGAIEARLVAYLTGPDTGMA